MQITMVFLAKWCYLVHINERNPYLLYPSHWKLFYDTIRPPIEPGFHCKAYPRLLSASLIYIIRLSPLSTPGPHHFRQRLSSQHTLYYSDVTLYYLPCGAVRGAQPRSRGHLMTALARVRRRCKIGIWRV